MSALKDVSSAAMPYVILAAIAAGVWLFRDKIAAWFSSAVAGPIADAVSGAGSQLTENITVNLTGDFGKNAGEILTSAGTLSQLTGGPGGALILLSDWLKGITGDTAGGVIPEPVDTGYTNLTDYLKAIFTTPGGVQIVEQTGGTDMVDSIPSTYVSPAQASGLLESLRAAAQGWRNRVVFANELPDFYQGETAREIAAGVDILYRDATWEIGRTAHSWWMTNLDGGPGTEAGSLGVPVSYALLNKLGL